MKPTTTAVGNQSLIHEMIKHLELGNVCGENGNIQQAIDHYIKGLQIDREIQDKPRIQQFSNLILNYI